MTRLVALALTPRVNLTRFHGVCAPNSKQGAVVMPAMRGSKPKSGDDDGSQRPPNGGSR